MSPALRAAAALASLALGLTAPAVAAAGVRSSFSPVSGAGGQGTLSVESDAADEIVVRCAGSAVLVNGAPPGSGPLACFQVNRLVVRGGPGANRVDLSGIAPAQAFGTFRGMAAYAEVSGGAGDDVVIGPGQGVVTLDGGPGSDRLEGRAIDRYVFGTAASPELDTVVEPGRGECDPSFFELNQPGVTWWTVPWDALDFTGLPAHEPVTVDGAAPTGVLAVQRSRTIRLEAAGGGIALEAVAGGAGDDVLVGACMVVGGAGADRLSGTAFDGDLVQGGAGDDAVSGGGGPDVLDGGPGADVLRGETGADALYGGSGDDALHGGAEGDVYLFERVAAPEADTVIEAPATGVDVLSFALPVGVPVEANLATRAERVASAGGLSVLTDRGGARNLEGLVGGAGPDRLIGHDGANHFWSGGGADFVAGGRGDDTYHVDWVGSMPYGAYGFWEWYWQGPFELGAIPSRSTFQSEAPPSLLRLVEPRRGGVDLLDLAERWVASRGSGSRLEGQLERGVRVDLSASRWLVRTPDVAVAAERGSAPNVERVRGTVGADTLVGNAAANVLEGRHGRDVAIGRAGRDTCVVYRNEDVLRGCERVTRADPDR